MKKDVRYRLRIVLRKDTRDVERNYLYIRDCRLMFSIWPKQPTDPPPLLHPVLQIYVFISHSGRFGRIFCPLSMTEAQFPCESTFLCAYFRFRQPPDVLSALFSRQAAPRLPCECRRRCTGFPSKVLYPRYGDTDRHIISWTMKRPTIPTPGEVLSFPHCRRTISINSNPEPFLQERSLPIGRTKFTMSSRI